MAVHGRPTPQPKSDEAEWPRFKDRKPHEYRRSDVNPFLIEHREFGPELLPADQTYPWRGKWDDCFGRPGPLHLEIGSGNGFFLTELARRHPDWNLLGMEIRYKRTVLIAKKLRAAGITNAKISRYHAAYLSDLFLPGSLDGLWVNHPDPWPKDKHEKNRLISRWFLEDVATYLKPGAVFRLKSDFRDNIYRIPRLLEADADENPLPRLPLAIHGIGDDVNNGDVPWEDDIQTNYQRKFLEKGEPVYAIELHRTDAPWPPTAD